MTDKQAAAKEVESALYLACSALLSTRDRIQKHSDHFPGLEGEISFMVQHLNTLAETIGDEEE
jgi:hypothetical protein